MSKSERTEKSSLIVQPRDEQEHSHNLRGSGQSFRAIGRALGRSNKVIRNFLNDPEQDDMKRSPGHPLKCTQRDEEAFRRAIHACSGNSSTSIKCSTAIAIVPTSIWTFLNSKNIEKRKCLQHPGLTAHHKEAHWDFAWVTQTWTECWKQVLYSDEKKFNLDGPDGFQYNWHDPELPKEIFSNRVSGGCSIMVWGAGGPRE